MPVRPARGEAVPGWNRTSARPSVAVQRPTLQSLPYKRGRARRSEPHLVRRRHLAYGSSLRSRDK